MSKQPPFKRVILYARQYRANHNVHETLQRLAAYLNKQKIDTYLDNDTAVNFDLNVPKLLHTEIGEKHDILVVVGGDGSLLSAARVAIAANVPVIGINRGRLGFLTDISPQDMEQQLTAVLQGHFQEERRSLLDMKIHDDQQLYYQDIALNDVVLSRGIETHLVAFDVYINQQFVSHDRSDGLIIATPTGSTAYALSAGGPILHPHLHATVIVPMFSHSLSSRPLVVDDHSEIQIVIRQEHDIDLRVSCDGHNAALIKPGQFMTIKKYPQTLRLLHPADYHYYDTLKIKLGWGKPQPHPL